MVTRLAPRSPRHRVTAVGLLVALCAASVAARVGWLGAPCHVPCRSASDHVLIFDESYYVNAARVIAGVRPPSGMPYDDAPPGDDPNAEHPQLAKLVIAGSVELFGDGPLAWRVGSVLAGTVALVGMFALVRAAGGTRWLAVAASALIASDNLLLVHGRIGTLDVFVVAAMIWGVAIYLRGRPVLAGLVLAVGACFKLVGAYALLVLGLIEMFRWVRARGEGLAGLRRLAGCSICAAGAFMALLALLDAVAPPYDAATGRRVTGGPLGHLGHMLSYAAHQTSPQGPRGIASYPWQWLGDYKPITYLNINPARPAPGLYHVHPAAHFLGVVSPPTLLLALPALALALASLVTAAHRSPRLARRGPWLGRPAPRLATPGSSDVGPVGLAWFIGTWVPFELLSLIWSRTSYLYYMAIVMPGIYLSVVALLERFRGHRRLLLGWAAAVIAAAVVLYPFTPLP